MKNRSYSNAQFIVSNDKLYTVTAGSVPVTRADRSPQIEGEGGAQRAAPPRLDNNTTKHSLQNSPEIAR